jgi:hypothetical protein
MIFWGVTDIDAQQFTDIGEEIAYKTLGVI